MILHTDGGCSGNGQLDITKRKMVMVVTDLCGNVLIEKEEDGGSNNIAELIAVREALNWCIKNGYKEVEIITDSKNTMSWVWNKKVGKKINDRERVMDIKSVIDEYLKEIKLSLQWKPREENWAGIHIENKYSL